MNQALSPLKLLITGGSGNLGRPLSDLSARHWPTTSTYFHNSNVGGGTPIQLDMRDAAAVHDLVRQVEPDIIIHAATSDRSEDMPNTIRSAAQHIGETAKAVRARLIALSTDVIFDGTQAPYDEDSPPTPVHPYGQAKADADRILLDTCENCLLVRTSLIYDLHPSNEQIRWMRSAIKAGESISLFEDEIRQPIWSWNLAQVLIELAEQDITGILNVAGPEQLSRWAFGSVLLRAIGYNPDKVARPTRAAEIAPKRPRNCTLVLDKALGLLKTPLVPISEALGNTS
nr:SDR family oxidoreductase [Anaerolineae bacterium]